MSSGWQYRAGVKSAGTWRSSRQPRQPRPSSLAADSGDRQAAPAFERLGGGRAARDAARGVGVALRRVRAKPGLPSLVTTRLAGLKTSSASQARCVLASGGEPAARKRRPSPFRAQRRDSRRGFGPAAGAGCPAALLGRRTGWRRGQGAGQAVPAGRLLPRHRWARTERGAPNAGPVRHPKIGARADTRRHGARRGDVLIFLASHAGPETGAGVRLETRPARRAGSAPRPMGTGMDQHGLRRQAAPRSITLQGPPRRHCPSARFHDSFCLLLQYGIADRKAHSGRAAGNS